MVVITGPNLKVSPSASTVVLPRLQPVSRWTVPSVPTSRVGVRTPSGSVVAAFCVVRPVTVQVRPSRVAASASTSVWRCKVTPSEVRVRLSPSSVASTPACNQVCSHWSCFIRSSGQPIWVLPTPSDHESRPSFTT